MLSCAALRVLLCVHKAFIYHYSTEKRDMAIVLRPWCILVFGFTVVKIGLGQIDAPPPDTIASVGNDLQMECAYPGSLQFEWMEWITDAAGYRIFSAPPDEQPENSDKYEIVGTYHLILRDAQVTDGGMYGCRSVDMPFYETANLVVIEGAILSVPDLIHGNTVEITCSVNYGAPLELDPDQTPNMRVTLDGADLGHSPVRVTPLPGPPGEYEAGVLLLAFSYTADIDDNGKTLACELYTTRPMYTDSVFQVLNIQ